MTKMIKLSMAAAVAVSAFATTATAGSLENAIKDTTISGKALVGYNYNDTNTASVLGLRTNTANATDDTTSNQTEYDFDITMNTKVNDTITFTSGIQADHTVDAGDTTDGSSVDKGDKITLTKLYFTAKTDAATVMIGKQKQPTPFLDDERGDGVVALVPAGPVTIAAGHFTGLVADEDITAAAVIGSVGPVNASLWYVDATNVADGYSLNLNGKFGPVNVDFTHSDLDTDADDSDASLTKLIVSGTVADVNLVVGYGMTNDSDNRGNVDLTGDADAKTNFRLDQINLDDFTDADALLLGASMTFGATTVGVNYLTADVDSVDADAEEINLNVKYAMSKNFSITGLYSDAEIEAGSTTVYDESRMELSLNYKF